MQAYRETELRATLTNQERVTMLQHMGTLGPVLHVARVMVEYSGANRTNTAKVRINNGAVEVVAKSGTLDAKTRSDVSISASSTPLEATHFLRILGKKANLQSVLAAPSSFEAALGLMARLGYVNAKVCVRDVHQIQHGGLELSIRDIISGHDGSHVDTLFEAEVKNPDWSDQEADAVLGEFFSEHDLTEVSGGAWINWVQKTHNQADLDFSYTRQAAQELAGQLTVARML